MVIFSLAHFYRCAKPLKKQYQNRLLSKAIDAVCLVYYSSRWICL